MRPDTRGRREAVADPTLRRLAPRVWIGGSPLRLFRLTRSGDQVVADLAAGTLGGPLSAGAGALLDRLERAGAAHPVPSIAAAPFSVGDVTVVVPVRDRTDDLIELLARLDQRCPIVVVDDGSVDADSVAAATERANTTLVRHDVQLGPAAARNAGWCAAGTALVAFVDSDARPEHGWLEVLLAHLADPQVAVVAPRVRSAPSAGRLACYEGRRSPLDLGAHPARVAPRTRVAYLPAAALLVRCRTLAAIGGFDETLRYGEDVDLIWRVTATGALVRYEPTAVVLHEPRSNWWKWFCQRVQYGSSAAPLDRRHPHMVAPVVLSPWSAALWGLVAGRRPLAAGVLGASTAVALRHKMEDVPAWEVLRLTASGHLGAGRQLARTMVRAWWPATVVASAISRRARRLAGIALAVHLLTTPGSISDRLLAVLDDAAYGTGVWRGVLHARSARALLPAFSSTS